MKRKEKGNRKERVYFAHRIAATANMLAVMLLITKSCQPFVSLLQISLRCCFPNEIESCLIQVSLQRFWHTRL